MTTTVLEGVNWRQQLTYRWTAPDLDGRRGGLITAGVDIGSVSTQAVIMVNGEIGCLANTRTLANSRISAETALSEALEGTRMTMADVNYLVGTGYGRVSIPMANKTITEIACHGRGANFVFGPGTRTVLDVGGQDAKIIRCDERGKVGSFIMNDKCAAGTGRGMEAFADLVGIPIQDVGPRSLEVPEEPQPVSVTCVVFAKSEALSMLRAGRDVNVVLAAYCRAMANRLADLVRRLGVEDEFVITGGQSKNVGVVTRIERELNVRINSAAQWDPQLAGAIGAALFANALAQQRATVPR